MWLAGSQNPFTPAGYVGYLTKGRARHRFYGVQKARRRPDYWLLDVQRQHHAYTYTEEFTGSQAVLSRDNLKISFAIHTVWRETKVRSSWAPAPR